ncbi:MAG: elongation factor G [Sporomusaceae bacterium]|jgi:elongation factor G|nr:elongation factor G [Sporomusaceae bacterium]
MKEYKSEKIRNVGIVAHGGAGKTSLAEALLFNSGAVTRLGRVDEGNATTDFEPEEIKRKVTISTAMAPCEWKDHKINFLDTPGYSDFAAEVKGTLRAVDAALVVVCASSGVEVETEKVWQYAQDIELPRMAFINKMDRENADFFGVVKEMQEKFGNHVVAVQIPIGSQENFRGIIDLISMKAYLAPAKAGGAYTEEDIPADLADTAEEARMALVEMAAEGDDEIMMKYLDGEELTADEIKKGIELGIESAKLFPVYCGSAYKNIGMPQLLDGIIAKMPNPAQRNVSATNPKSGDSVEIKADSPFSALVFKTTADPFVGRLSYIRIFSGLLKSDTSIYNVNKDKTERIGNVFTMKGKTQDLIPTAYAGDIVVLAKLQETTTGDTLGTKENPVIFEKIDYPKPMFSRAIEAKNKGDEDKIGNALNRIIDEDPTFKTHKNTETRQLLINGMGELHLDIIVEKMKRKFGVDALLSDPKVPYRETIRGTVKVEGKHKKQSGGHGQFGHVWLQIDPLAPGENFEFVDKIVGGAVPRQYIPAVEKGVRDTMADGVLAGYPLIDIRVTLYDGSYHTVDSSEMAFKIASTMALKKGVLQAKPVLLEPINSVEIIVPSEYMGDVIGDLNSKRGRVQGMDSIGGGKSMVKAQVPLSEMFRYNIDLRAITQGKGIFDMDFSHYEEVPQRTAETIVAAYKKTKEED